MGMSAARGLPAIAARQCMCYLRDNLNDDAMLSEYIAAHSQAIEELIPIETTGDRNCFWNAISIVLCGNESLSLALRFLTAYGLIRYRRELLSLIMLDSIYEHAPNHIITGSC